MDTTSDNPPIFNKNEIEKAITLLKSKTNVEDLFKAYELIKKHNLNASVEKVLKFIEEDKKSFQMKTIKIPIDEKRLGQTPHS